MSYNLVQGFIELKRIPKHGLSGNCGFESHYITLLTDIKTALTSEPFGMWFFRPRLENEGLFARFQTVPATSLAVLVAQGCAKHWISGHPSGRAYSFHCFEKMCLLYSFLIFFFVNLDYVLLEVVRNAAGRGPCRANLHQSPRRSLAHIKPAMMELRLGL